MVDASHRTATARDTLHGHTNRKCRGAWPAASCSPLLSLPLRSHSPVARTLLADKAIDIVEQFNQKLILKQSGDALRIIDLLDSSVVTVSSQKFRTPSAFIFLYEYNTFLAFESNHVRRDRMRSCTRARAATPQRMRHVMLARAHAQGLQHASARMHARRAPTHLAS